MAKTKKSKKDEELLEDRIAAERTFALGGGLVEPEDVEATEPEAELEAEPMAEPEVAADPEPVAEPAPAPVPAPEEPTGLEDDPESMEAYQSLMRHRRQRRRKKIIIAAACAVAALAIVGSVVAGNAARQQQAEMPQVQTTPIFREDFSESVSAQGSLKPISSVVVTPEVDGIIENLYVSEGSKVNAGDILFTIKNDELDKAVSEAEIAVRTAENNVTSARNALDALRREEERDNAAIAEAEIALDSANLALDSANETFAAALATAQKRTVTAAASGELIVMNAVLGQAVGSAAGSGTLMQIADLSQMTVTVQVNELDISKIAVDQTAVVSFSALPDLELEATVTRIANVSGSGDEPYGYGVVSYDVDLIIPEPDERLKPGMTATVDVRLQHLPDVLTVPLSAISSDENGEPCIYVVTDEATGSAETRPVTVLAQSSTTAAIEGAVEEGELVQLVGYAPVEDEFADGPVAVY